MKCFLSTWAALLVAAALHFTKADTQVSTPPLPGATEGVLDAIAHGGHHDSPLVHQRGVSAFSKKGRPLRPEIFWKPKKERSAKHEHRLHPATAKKHGKMPGEGKRWKWKSLNITDWKGAAAKRMPGFHRKRARKGKGKRKGIKPHTPAAVRPTLPEPPTVQQASAEPDFVKVISAEPSSVSQGVAAPPQSVGVPAAQPVLPQATSTPQVVTGNFVFNPVTQTWTPVSAAGTSPPKGWAAETLAPAVPRASTTVAPAIFAPATAAALRGSSPGYPYLVASSTFAPVAHYPAPAQWAPMQYHAVAPTTTAFWR